MQAGTVTVVYELVPNPGWAMIVLCTLRGFVCTSSVACSVGG